MAWKMFQYFSQTCTQITKVEVFLKGIVMICLSIHEFGTFLASNFISKWSKKFSNPLFSFHSLKRSLHFYHLHRLGSRCRAGCPSSSVDSLMVLDQLIYSWKICIHFNFRLLSYINFFYFNTFHCWFHPTASRCLIKQTDKILPFG